MSARPVWRSRWGILSALSLLGVAGVAAQSLDVTRHVIASGGGNSSGGTFSVSGTVGQAEASATLAGGAFTLRGGYWTGAAQAGTGTLFKDGFENP